MKQILKFVEEYKPGDNKFDPWEAIKFDNKYPSLRWVEIQFVQPERSGGYTYMEVVLYQENQWSVEAGEMIEFRKENVVLHKDTFYAFNHHDKRLSITEHHLMTALAMGNFLGREACSAVHSLLWKVMDFQKDIWIKYLPGVFAYRDSLNKNE